MSYDPRQHADRRCPREPELPRRHRAPPKRWTFVVALCAGSSHATSRLPDLVPRIGGRGGTGGTRRRSSARARARVRRRARRQAPVLQRPRSRNAYDHPIAAHDDEQHPGSAQKRQHEAPGGRVVAMSESKLSERSRAERGDRRRPGDERDADDHRSETTEMPDHTSRLATSTAIAIPTGAAAESVDSLAVAVRAPVRARRARRPPRLRADGSTHRPSPARRRPR